MGFTRCVMPEANIDHSRAEASVKIETADRSPVEDPCELVGVRTVGEALEQLLS